MKQTRKPRLRTVRFTMAGMVLLTAVSLVPSPYAYGADKTTKYRVYQNDQLLTEFADYTKAQQYAAQFWHSRVEDINSRDWLWNNFPRYRVYQQDASLPDWEFARLEDAIREAKNWGYSSVRDLQSGGWVWNNYPKYRVYQGDSLTQNSWEFESLNDAVAEARKWDGSHIIDLRTNDWVWDNWGDNRKTELRSRTPVYRMYQGTYSAPDWSFSYLEDAVREALKWGGSTIINTSDNSKTVFSNAKPYSVYQSDNLLESFTSLDDAVSYAQNWWHGNIHLNSKKIWSNAPAYMVYQSNNEIGEYSSIPTALQYAKQFSNASIRNETGQSIWNNFRKLMYWGWNGVSGLDTIKSQVSPTQGLDVDSPSWFQLGDETGTLIDSSSKDTADYLKKQGYTVHPLISNQFDGALTSRFFLSSAAQDTFIRTLIDRCAQLDVNGINVDFESLSGKDRAAYTSFMRKLTNAAHTKGLTVSIDLPRGSVKWNAQTAYDHEALAEIVDYVMMMAYDQYYSGSTSPGSVAGLQWVEEGIQEYLSYGIPRDKLMLGIPFYVREWTLDAAGKLISNRPLYTRDLSSVLNGKSAAATWDNSFQQFKVEFTDGGNKKVLWLESQDTLKARLDLAKKYNLAGVAMWRLGQEPSDFWSTLIQNK